MQSAALNTCEKPASFQTNKTATPTAASVTTCDGPERELSCDSPAGVIWQLFVDHLAALFHLEGVGNMALRPVAPGLERFDSVQGQKSRRPHVVLRTMRKQPEGVTAWVVGHATPESIEFIEIEGVEVHGAPPIHLEGLLAAAANLFVQTVDLLAGNTRCP